jgi:hypothetical protein
MSIEEAVEELKRTFPQLPEGMMIEVVRKHKP